MGIMNRRELLTNLCAIIGMSYLDFKPIQAESKIVYNDSMDRVIATIQRKVRAGLQRDVVIYATPLLNDPDLKMWNRRGLMIKDPKYGMLTRKLKTKFYQLCESELNSKCMGLSLESQYCIVIAESIVLEVISREKYDNDPTKYDHYYLLHEWYTPSSELGVICYRVYNG